MTCNMASAFEAVASPPRFELKANPGQVVRGVFEITNAGRKRESYGIKTMDWTFSKDAAVQMHDKLLSDSCRPWVRIERPVLTLNSGQKYKYRFEVAVPEGSLVSECKFIITIDGDAQVVEGGPPIAGRLGIVVYVNIAGAKPILSVGSALAKELNGQKTPSVEIKNDGNAHGRINGFLKVVDNKGEEFEVTPSTYPIMAGETRFVFFQPENKLEKWMTIEYPVTLTGDIEWEGGKHVLNVKIER